MADKTVSFKVSDDTSDQVKRLIEGSGLTAKDWLENAVSLYEVKTLGETAPEYTQSLSELEIHTTRIYELTVNMIKQAMYTKDEAVRDLDKKYKESLLESNKRAVELVELNKVAKQNQEGLLQSEQEVVKKEKELERAYATIENNQSLINEVQAKNEELAERVVEYTAYKVENDSYLEKMAQMKQEQEQVVNEKFALENALTQMNETIEHEKAAAATAIQKLTDEARANEQKLVNQYKLEMAQLEENHQKVLELQAQQQHLALEKARLDLQSSYQEKLQAETERLQALHDKRIEQFYNVKSKDSDKNK